MSAPTPIAAPPAARSSLRHARGRARGSQAGFTLMETLVALAVFAISVVGLVALESRSIESQRAARDIRDAERLAQEAMAELESQGFLQLIAQDFEGNANPAFPYDDSGIPPADRTRDQNRPPADIANTDDVIGSVRGSYIVYRSVDMVFDPAQPPSNPPILGTDDSLVTALVLDVVVLWVDGSNPAYPAPDGLAVSALVPEMTDPGDPEFRPYVGSVRLRHVRANDAVLLPPGGP
jgi:prepilin-type N-terminal cleavage/methylation domain-containing protein